VTASNDSFPASTAASVGAFDFAAAAVAAVLASMYMEGAHPPFATTLLPSFVDRAPFLECITSGPVAHALAGMKAASGFTGDTMGGKESAWYAGPLLQSPTLEGTPLGRAKRRFDDAALALLTPAAGAGARLAAAAAAALDTTRLVYIEVCVYPKPKTQNLKPYTLKPKP